MPFDATAFELPKHSRTLVPGDNPSPFLPAATPDPFAAIPEQPAKMTPALPAGTVAEKTGKAAPTAVTRPTTAVTQRKSTKKRHESKRKPKH
jgi:hypothetical protein